LTNHIDSEFCDLMEKQRSEDTLIQSQLIEEKKFDFETNTKKERRKTLLSKEKKRTSKFDITNYHVQ